jgi:carbon-monoxide dehydrogenase medium subunit
MTAFPPVHRARSLDEALEELERFPEAEPLAGGTWIMRAPLRGESFAPGYVGLDGVAALREIDSRGDVVAIGSLVTHAQLAAGDGPPAFAAIATAARLSAFPAVRSVATVAGNIAARGFPEADLVPALLAADATVEVVSRDGADAVPLAAYLSGRDRGPAGELITGVSVPAPAGRRSGFARLTVRGGGEYAVASVAVSVDLDDGGVVQAARLAVGGVEETARMLPGAAELLAGSTLAPTVVAQVGAVAAAACRPREGLDAPGWYRRAVLPGLVRRAIADLEVSA